MPMPLPGSRRRGLTQLIGVLAASTLLASAVAGCDAVGGNETAPKNARAAVRPSPSPTPVWDRSPDSIAAVGDSITRGFDACEALADCPEVSWATGTDTEVRSLAQRLLGGTAGAADRSWNDATTGARVSDLAGQLTRAAAMRPELVTVMVGANDACRDRVSSMTPVAEFRRGFETALKGLRARLPKAGVYVASVPDLKRLWSQGKGSPMGRQVWKLGICASMLGDAESMDAAAVERRQSVQDRVIAYNEALEDVCAEDERCRFDGGDVFAYRFGAEQLSQIDWFHPSKDGQERLAEIAYRNITAERTPE